MEEQVIKINGCIDCPFLIYQDSLLLPYCRLTKNDIKESPVDLIDVPVTPDDCPIKTQNIKVKFK